RTQSRGEARRRTHTRHHSLRLDERLGQLTSAEYERAHGPIGGPAGTRFPSDESEPRRGCPPARPVRGYAGLHCALNCCSTTLLAPSTSVAVTRRVSFPLRCRSEIWASKEPGLVRVRVDWRRDAARALRMSSVIVAGSDTVMWSLSRRSR